MSRGYLIYAIDEPYISKAETLKKSIEYYTNDSVTILSDKFPDGDATYGKKHKIHNFWQIYTYLVCFVQ